MEMSYEVGTRLDRIEKKLDELLNVGYITYQEVAEKKNKGRVKTTKRVTREDEEDDDDITNIEN